MLWPIIAIFYELWVCFRTYQKVLVVVIFGKDFYDVTELADKCVDYFFGGRFELLKGILPIIHNVLPKKSGFPRKFSA